MLSIQKSEVVLESFQCRIYMRIYFALDRLQFLELTIQLCYYAECHFKYDTAFKLVKILLMFSIWVSSLVNIPHSLIKFLSLNSCEKACHLCFLRSNGKQIVLLFTPRQIKRTSLKCLLKKSQHHIHVVKIYYVTILETRRGICVLIWSQGEVRVEMHLTN